MIESDALSIESVSLLVFALRDTDEEAEGLLERVCFVTDTDWVSCRVEEKVFDGKESERVMVPDAVTDPLESEREKKEGEKLKVKKEEVFVAKEREGVRVPMCDLVGTTDPDVVTAHEKLGENVFTDFDNDQEGLGVLFVQEGVIVALDTVSEMVSHRGQRW